MKIPETDDNFRIQPNGNVIVTDWDRCTEEQKEYFGEQLEQEIFRLQIEKQSRGVN